MVRQVIRFVLFATITLGLTVWIGAQIARYQPGERYQLAATFDDVTGLFVGDDVKLAGVQVGRVTSIGVEHGQAEVHFRIDRDIELPADSTVAVRWRNLIGQRYLYVYEGTADELLPTDGSAVVENSRGVTDITQLVNTLGPLFTSVDPDQLNDLFDTLVQALDGNQDNLANLVSDLNGIVGTLAERESTIQQVLGDYATITDQLANRDQQIEAMVDNLVLLSQTFADNTALVDRATVELSGFSSNLDTLLTANEGHLASILTNLGLITDTAVTRLDDLEGALNNLPAALRELFDVVNDGEYLHINVPCLSLSPPPCSTVSGNGIGGAAAGPTSLGTADALRDLQLGMLEGPR